MATTRATFWQLHSDINIALKAGRYIYLEEGEPTEDLRRCGTQLPQLPVPVDHPAVHRMKPVKAAREMAEAHALFAPPSTRRFSETELREYRHWTADDLLLAEKRHDLPKADAFRVSTADNHFLNPNRINERTWRKDLIDKWMIERRQLALEALRLVGDTDTGRRR